MYERMLDKTSEPSVRQLTDFCGEDGGLRFAAFNAYLADRHGATQEIRFPYGNGYGWCVTHRSGKKLICDVFAEKGAFTVMVRLTDKQFFSVYDGLSADAKRLVDNRYKCGEGGWVHFRITTDRDLADAESLLDAKCGK